MPGRFYCRVLSAKGHDFTKQRGNLKHDEQAEVSQYLLAVGIWEFIRSYIPSPRVYREEGLQEGVNEGTLRKSGGSFTDATPIQDSYLLENSTYQTWHLMSNMKEVLAECVAVLLASRYGPLNAEFSRRLLEEYDLKNFLTTGSIRETAADARSKYQSFFDEDEVFGRLMSFLRYVSQQYWVDNKATIQTTPRIRTHMIRAESVAGFKKELMERNDNLSLDRPFKPEGKTFVDSLPKLP